MAGKEASIRTNRGITYTEASVVCILEVVSLDDNPVYEALSDACGHATTQHVIQVNSNFLDIKYSAMSALTKLHERSNPVKLMGDIYRNARSVCVWLGPEEAGERNIMQLLRKMGSVHGVNDTVQSAAHPQVDTVVKVKHFFARYWWERLWVVQEIAFGEFVVLQIGQEELGFEEVLSAYNTCDTWFWENLMGLKRRSHSSIGYGFMETFETVNIMNHVGDIAVASKIEDDTSGQRILMLALIAAANLLRNRKTAIDRDRLHALFGLLPSGLLSNPGMNPSYTSSTEEAFAEVTYNLKKFSKSFIIFGILAQSECEVPDTGTLLPSWVPDWRKRPSNSFEGNLRAERENSFGASGASPFHLRRLTSNTLCMSGMLIDVIEGHQDFSVIPTTQHLLQAIYRYWHERWVSMKSSKRRWKARV
ncbi:hypothetical protein VTL71DRAFT_15771 [Oculimacula yallundae]|uniref:Heterokaryon incompatibility domain-containing protein n=1 Tax=Oculimacula yallundae TaxID=86028 RepID=A0ABR4CD51_9HELO